MQDPAAIQIQHLHPDRWQDYKTLRLEALRTDPGAFGANYEATLQRPDEWWRGHLEKSQQDPNKTVLFATDQNQLIGMGGAYPEEDPRYVDIVGMYVTPSQRGRGVGRAILDAIVQRVQAEEIRLCVNAHQTGAVRLYQNFGFVTIAETPLTHPDGTPYTQFYMALRTR